MQWQYSDFNGLTLFALYEALRLRQSVFVIEQKCLFLDADGLDPLAMHLMGWKESKLAVYARILPPGVKYGEHSIGRVVVEPKARKGGLARAAMREAIARILAASPGAAIRIQAQNHLADTLYKPLGFERISPVYDEDGVPHVDMMLRIS